MIDIHRFILSTSIRDDILDLPDEAKRSLILQTIGFPIKTQGEFLRCLQLPHVNYSPNPCTLIFNLYELFFAALHISPEQKNTFTQMLDDKLAYLFTQDMSPAQKNAYFAQMRGDKLADLPISCSYSELYEILKVSTTHQKDIYFENIGFERIGLIINSHYRLIEVLNILSDEQGKGCIQTFKQRWYANIIPDIQTLLDVYPQLISPEIKREFITRLYPVLVTDQEKHQQLLSGLPREIALLDFLKRPQIPMWNHNKRLEILHNLQHPLHVSFAWNDASNFLDNLKILFALPTPFIPLLTPDIKIRIHEAISAAKPSEIKSLLFFLQKELWAIDDQTIFLSQTTSRFTLFSPQSAETSDIALRLQFAIEKLQGLSVHQQTLEQQSSSSASIQLRD